MKESEREPNRPDYHTFQGRGTDFESKRMRRGGGTKEVFFPCLGSLLSGVFLGIGEGFGGGLMQSSGDTAVLLFNIPYDFSAIVTARLLVVPIATQAAANWDINAIYGSVSEHFDVHNVADTATTYNVTDSHLYSVDAATILVSIVAGDVGKIVFTLSNSAHDVALLGLALKYTVA